MTTSQPLHPGMSVQITFLLYDATTGDLLDDAHQHRPLPVRLGRGDIIAGLEDALYGLRPGEPFDVTLSPEQGYGKPNNQMIQKVPREAAPPGAAVGHTVHATIPGLEGLVDPMVFRITAVRDEVVVLDGNHPFAGKTVRFVGAVL